jgi:hypothetical protein|tara:strand:+ start:43 stop:705 length:663 start_codon:yes stop_codon:yes gene_type:complete
MEWDGKYCVYIIGEYKKQFTTNKNKCNSLYAGQTRDWNQRIQKYQNPNPLKNELIKKLSKHLKMKKTDTIQRFDNKNIYIKQLISKNFVDNNYREEVEGYIIKRLNPLLNLAKRDGIFERNYKKFKENRPIVTYEIYKEDCEEYFGDWYRAREDIGGTERIYHPIKRMYVDRDSYAGEDAEYIQFERKRNKWFWDTNKLQFKYELWRTNKEKWKKELRFR